MRRRSSPHRRRAVIDTPRVVSTLAIAILACACTAHPTRSESGRRTHTTLRLINATFDSVVALAVAPAGSNDFSAVALREPLQGGLNVATFHVPAGGCMRDLRIAFSDGDVATWPAIDICRSDGLRISAKSTPGATHRP